jgi:predicted lactoylglutathione lyase
MIGYVTLGTNDLETAVSFYDELLASIGATRIFEQDNFVAWSTGPANPALSVSRPYDGEPATIGNGVMIAIALDAPEKVDAFYAKVMELGGSDEGAPGLRGETFYAAYFRDLDGNKLNAFCMLNK